MTGKERSQNNMPDVPEVDFNSALCEIWSTFNYAAYHLAYVRVYLQTAALQREQSRFLFLGERHKSGLCFDTESNKIVAFVVWSENHEAVARQLFVIAEERRKGIATDLMRFWVKDLQIV